MNARSSRKTFNSLSAAAMTAFAALVLAAAPARGGSKPQGALDECYGKPLAVHVTGWTFDPDVSSQSTAVQVYLYTDSALTHQYGSSLTGFILAAALPRPDVNQALGVVGDHGFDADISVPAGTYWVQVVAVDVTGDGFAQVGSTLSVTVAPRLPGSGTPADPYRISSAADWNIFASNISAGFDSNSCYRLGADIGSVTVPVGTAEHPFAGTFDGGSNTLTVALSGSDRAIAPFFRISGATIRNLKVAGTVSGAIHCSGLVGEVVGGTNLIENCEVVAAISSSESHFGGFIGHSVTYAVTLRGCVFSGSLSGGTYVATFSGWSDDGATTTLIDCLDASASAQPIGRGTDAACVSNTYYLASKNFGNGERLWSEGKRGKRAYAVTAGEGVAIGFGAPSATYGTTRITAYPTGLAYRGSGAPTASSGTFYAAEGDSVRLALSATPPSGMILDAYAASAGTLTQIGSAWTLSMPDGPVVVNANWTPTGTHGKVRLWAGAPFWAETNVGADEPWESGYYFWWGDTLGYRLENDDTLVASDGSNSSFSLFDFCFEDISRPTFGKDNATLLSEGWVTADGVLAPAHDAAQAHWGGAWRMPTDLELADLVNNCDWTWTTLNGVNGYVVRGRGDYSAASIFLPASGLWGNGDGGYWSAVPHGADSECAFGLLFFSDNIGSEYNHWRSNAEFVRPVQTPASTVKVTFSANGGTVSPSSLLCTPDEAYGSLPAATRAGYAFAGWFTEASGGTQVTAADIVPASATTLYAHWTADTRGKIQLWEGGPYWAETNVGADEPWEYGYYFWWGDTLGHKLENGAWVASDGSASNFSFDSTYGKDIATLLSEGWITTDNVLAPEHDAAQAHWGGDWRMPTDQELRDLFNNCDWVWTTMNGVSGCLVRGRGNFVDASIFLPATGYGSASLLNDAGSSGGIWASTPIEVNTIAGASYIFFDSNIIRKGAANIYNGLPIRPVWSPSVSSALDLVDNADNSAVIAAADGMTLSVRLAGRTLRKDGSWQTLCLPFNVNGFTDTPLDGAIVKELNEETSNLDGNGTLTLNFKNATSIEAGKPYIVKWQLADGLITDAHATEIIDNPVFNDVTIDADAGTAVSFTGGQFVGTFSSMGFTVNDPRKLFLNADSAICYTNSANNADGKYYLNACRAYLQLNDLQAGVDVKRYVLNFGDKTVTGDFPVIYDLWAAANGLGAWDAADASGVHNVFRYLFDVPTGAFTNPPLLSISFDASGNPVIHTPPLNPSATDFDISILATPTLTGTPDGEGVSTYPLDPSGSTTIPQNGNTTRFFRLRVEQHVEVFVPVDDGGGDDIVIIVPLN